MIEIKIDGVEELVRIIGSAATMQIMRRPITESVIHVEGKMKVYPPQRSGTKYRRTGTLGRRWTHEVSEGGDEIRGVVGNNTSYGPYVQSQQFQAKVHHGFWQNTDENVIRDEQDTIVSFFDHAVEDALNGR
jgi:hypothetical protein